MKVLITGAAGFVGSWLVCQLAKDGNVGQVVAFDNLSDGNFDYLLTSFPGKSKVRPIIGDVLNARLLDRSFSGVDVVVHVAGVKTASDIHTYDQVNNWGTAEVVAAFERSNAKKFVFISDIAVYGLKHQELPLQVNPTTPYEHSIVRAEAHVERLVKKGMASVIRVGELIGLAPSKSSVSSVNADVFKGFLGGKAEVLGNGSIIRNITSLKTVSETVLSFLNGSLNGAVYDVVDFSIPSIQLVAEIREVFPELEIIFLSHHFEEEGCVVRKSDEVRSCSDEFLSLIKEIKKALN